MRKLKLSALLLMFGTASLVQAQEATVPNVLNIKSAQQSGEIYENDKLVGYYVFFIKEKADKANTAYEVELFDDNYNQAGTFEIVRPKKTIMLEMSYNGTAFMLHFYDQKTGYEFVTYDSKGVQLGSQKMTRAEISKYDLARAEQNLASATENVTIYKNGKEGFVRSTFTKNEKVGYQISAYDNAAKVVWTFASKADSKLVETVEIVDVSEEVISATVYKKKNAMTREMEVFCLLLNSKTGKLIKEFSLGTDETGKKSILKSFINEKTGKLLLVGEFYKPKDDILKDRSQGLYLQELTLEGDEVSFTEYKWKGDIDKFKNATLDDEEKKGDARPFALFFHDVIVSENGTVFLVGEQFIKQVSAGGVAMKAAAVALGGSTDASSFEIQISNMVVIEFGADKSLVDFEVIKKKSSRIILPQGPSYYGTSFLGHYLNSLGAFDYAFTARNEESDEFTVAYVDGNRKEEKESVKSDMMIGVVHIEGGQRSNSRVPINTASKVFWIQPAKTGHISITEYDKKMKKLNLRLEPLTY